MQILPPSSLRDILFPTLIPEGPGETDERNGLHRHIGGKMEIGFPADGLLAPKNN
jgi:hypothetical protein